MAVADFLQCGIPADFKISVEFDTALFEQVDTALDDVFFQLEIGDAVYQQAADPVVAVIDMHLVAFASQLIGSGHAGGPAADDADRLIPFARW